MALPSDGTFKSFISSRYGLTTLLVFLLSLVFTLGFPSAIIALGAVKSHECELLTEQLKNPDPEIRALAAEELGDEFGYSSRARESLKEALRDEDANVRLTAAGALAENGDFTAGDEMVRTLFWVDCEYPYEHSEMIEFMLNSGDPEVESATEQWLNSCGTQVEYDSEGYACPVDDDF